MRIRSLVAALGAILALVGSALLATPSAQASTTHTSVSHSPDARRVHCRTPHCWGAISLSVDGATGLSYNYPTKGGAIHAAARACKSRSHYDKYCTPTHNHAHAWFRNQCGAVWYKTNPRGFVTNDHFGFGHYKAAAVKHARGKHKHGGHVSYSCTARRY